MNEMEMKEQILKEILDDLDSHEGEKLRPKEMSITAVGPEEKEPSEESDSHPLAMAEDDDDKMDPDDLKALLQEYLHSK